jgi:hypothetical protein
MDKIFFSEKIPKYKNNPSTNILLISSLSKKEIQLVYTKIVKNVHVIAKDFLTKLTISYNGKEINPNIYDNKSKQIKKIYYFVNFMDHGAWLYIYKNNNAKLVIFGEYEPLYTLNGIIV